MIRRRSVLRWPWFAFCSVAITSTPARTVWWQSWADVSRQQIAAAKKLSSYGHSSAIYMASAVRMAAVCQPITDLDKAKQTGYHAQKTLRFAAGNSQFIAVSDKSLEITTIISRLVGNSINTGYPYRAVPVDYRMMNTRFVAGLYRTSARQCGDWSGKTIKKCRYWCQARSMQA